MGHNRAAKHAEFRYQHEVMDLEKDFEKKVGGGFGCRPVSMAAWKESMQNRRVKGMDYHHCTGCCARCKEEDESTDLEAVKTLRCHASKGSITMAFLVSLGGIHNGVEWPSAVGEALAFSNSLPLPFRDISMTHPTSGTVAACSVYKKCVSSSYGTPLERLINKSPPLKFPRNLLLLITVSEWGGRLAEVQEMLSIVIRAGGDCSETDEEGCTALYYASGRKCFANEDTLTMLAGPNRELVNAGDIYNRTPLFRACEEGLSEIVAILLKLGASPVSKNVNCLTPLHKAIEGNINPTVLGLLCSKQAVEARSDKGWTPLHFAAHHLCPAAIAVLLRHGADPRAKADTPKGMAPIQLARLHQSDATIFQGKKELFRSVIRALDWGG
eukprot:TRINITY_DN7395_c3_g1_i1.p1 TRINITY_DN7395_c3_g1~~TRINITY_DN7395_c3_g1_i1.p1  ORF type:complete len:398 (+),score=54.34 TRINITY_DN7395_c3_g1_i1:44-1195(+)